VRASGGPQTSVDPLPEEGTRGLGIPEKIHIKGAIDDEIAADLADPGLLEGIANGEGIFPDKKGIPGSLHN